MKVARRSVKTAFVLGPSAAVRHAVQEVFGARRHRTSCLEPYTSVRFVWDFDAERVPDGDAVVVYDWSTALRAAALPNRCGRKFCLVQAEECLLGAPERWVRAALSLPYECIVVSNWLKSRLRTHYSR